MTTLPAWWTIRDGIIAATYRDHYAAMGTSPEPKPWPELAEAALRCRHCYKWQSADGITGNCTMPATEATVNCGRTVWDDCCEQWHTRLGE
jgi:hypothetical protein